MRRIPILLLAVLALAACSRPAKPPHGRWIGNYESAAVMVDAWLEIQPDGTVRASAPDLTDVGTPTDAERAVLHARLAAQAQEDWKGVVPRRYDFDGRVFRKPGGIAPQMEWDARSKQMKLVFYFGMQHSIRIAMREVADFGDDPWAGAAH